MQVLVVVVKEKVGGEILDGVRQDSEELSARMKAADLLKEVVPICKLPPVIYQWNESMYFSWPHSAFVTNPTPMLTTLLIASPGNYNSPYQTLLPPSSKITFRNALFSALRYMHLICPWLNYI